MKEQCRSLFLFQHGLQILHIMITAAVWREMCYLLLQWFLTTTTTITVITRKNKDILWWHDHGIALHCWLTEQCLMSPPTQYRLYGSPEGRSYKRKPRKRKQHKIQRHTYNPLVYNNTIGWLGDGSHRGQGRQAWRMVGLPQCITCSAFGCVACMF